MGGFSEFEKTYCINLDRRKDRWRIVDRLSKEVNIELTRIPGVEGIDLDVQTTPYFKGQLGCLLSHKNVLQDMLNNGYEKIIVLEDDATFHPQFINKFDEFYKQLPHDWGFCYLGGSNMRPPLPISKNAGRAVETLSTVGYLITKSFAKNILLPMLSRKDVDYEVDVNFAKLQKEHNMYIFMPRLIYQYESYSDIQMKNVFYSHQADF